MTWKSYAAVSGAGLLATYLFSTPPIGVPDRAPARSTPVARGTSGPRIDISEEASRLQVRQREDVRYDEPSRNPFRFGARHVARPPARVEEAAPPEPVFTPPPPLPQPPPIRVSGIATNSVDGTRQRSAILVTPAGVVSVREGDAVGTEYRVTRIDEDAVELTGVDGGIRRIPLRP